MSAAAAQYKKNYYDGVQTGPSNINPCFRCLQKAGDIIDVHDVCTIVGTKPPTGMRHKCNHCQKDKNADCIQVGGAGCDRMA